MGVQPGGQNPISVFAQVFLSLFVNWSARIMKYDVAAAAISKYLHCDGPGGRAGPYILVY